MQTAHHFRFYNRAIRTRIGDELRALFVPTESTPQRLLELLHMLDQPKRSNAGRSRTELAEDLKFPKAKRAPGRISEILNREDKTGGSGTVPPASAFAHFRVTKKRSGRTKHTSDTSEKERVEKISGGYIVRDASGEALVYLYCGASETEAVQANVLTEDEARRLAINVARLVRLLKHND